jgi:hypothetical protein
MNGIDIKFESYNPSPHPVPQIGTCQIRVVRTVDFLSGYTGSSNRSYREPSDANNHDSSETTTNINFSQASASAWVFDHIVIYDMLNRAITKEHSDGTKLRIDVTEVFVMRLYYYLK